MRYGVRKKKELVLWGILCVGLILLYLLSSTDWIIKEKEVEVYPVSLIISDTSDDDYVNFRKGVDQAAVEYNVDVSFITLYEKDNLAQQMELVRREAADGAGAVILEPVDELNAANIWKKIHMERRLSCWVNYHRMRRSRGRFIWTGRQPGESWARRLRRNRAPIFLSGSLQITHISARRGR